MLIVKKHKKLLLNLRDPERVTSIVPGAKTVSIKGHDIVSVDHDQDTVRVLRNIGIKAPGPICSYYEWAGRYAPYTHQKETSEFASLSPRCYILNSMGCVDSETEYLSPTGWVRIADYAGGDVAQYLPETESIEFVTPQEYVKLPCAEMVRIKTKYGIDQKLSLEHRVLLRSSLNVNKREVVSAAELLRRHDVWASGANTGTRSLTSIAYTAAAIPTTFRAPGGDGVALTDDEIRLQVAVIADGYFPSRTRRCTMRLKKSRKKARLRALLCAAGVDYRERDCSSAAGFTLFTFYAPMRTKEFGPSWWSCTPEQLKVVIDEVMHWDGSIKPGARADSFFSTSKLSADFVQFAAVSNGHTARIREDVREGRNTCYGVTVRRAARPLQLASVSSQGVRHRVMAVEPSTDGFKYCFRVPSTFLVFRRNGCVFASGNTGKSISVLWAYDYLRKIGVVNWCLVVSPLSTLERVWADEVFRHFPDMSYGVVYGTAERRMKIAQDKYDIYIINHDGIKNWALLKHFACKPGKGLIIVDELACFRNASTDRWKRLNALVNGNSKMGLPPKEWVWGLTGTPTPNEPTDAWAQCRLITPGSVPKFFATFRDVTMRQVTQYKWVPRSDAIDTVHRVMQPAIRFNREDCIDLPATTYTTREVPMTHEQDKMYKQMFSQFKAEFAGGQLTAVNEAVMLSKLVQIGLGCAIGADGELIHIPNKPRIDAVLEVIEQASAKVIVFVPYTGALHATAEAIRAHHTVAVVNGEVPKRQRDDIFHDFLQPHGAKVLVAQPGTMAHGLSLTCADTIVWLAPINSAETYQQANARIARPGQKLNTLIVRIQGSDIERKMYERLDRRESTQGLLLNMFE